LVNDLSQTESNLTSDLDSLEGQLYELRQKRDQLTEQRKELWRAENKLDTSIVTLREEVGRCERSLMGAMDRGTMDGIEAVRRIAAQLNLPGVYGPLYELFEVDDVYRVATETIAGTSLFHVVVDNDATASRLLEVMIKEKSGRVTFMPLNRLRPPTVSFPADRDEALPLVQQLRFDALFEPAIKQVFGKTVLCRDLSKGAAIARQSGLTAITLNGDRADKKGAISGGFVDGRSGRLELASKWKMWNGKLKDHVSLLAEVKSKLSAIEPHITRVLRELESMECRRAELRRGGGALSDLDLRRKELAAGIELINVKRKTRHTTEGQIVNLQLQIASISAEVGTPLTSKLAPEEQSELVQVRNLSDEERKVYNEISSQVTQMATEMTNMETELDVSLRRRRHDLTLQLGQFSTKAITSELQLAEAEVAHLAAQIQTSTDSTDRLSKEIKHVLAESHNIETALDKARSLYDEAMKSHTLTHSTMEKYLTKRMALLERRESVQKRICELAVAPDAPLYESLRDLNGSALMKRLHATNEELNTRFAHVNKRAHEQHSNFDRQGETLRERQKELKISSGCLIGGRTRPLNAPFNKFPKALRKYLKNWCHWDGVSW
jgi:structural maintenance of chromosome 3 (chondroitin sulfate proteoglycan 6)